MKMSEVLAIINERSQGFLVSFERKQGCILAHDYFPDRSAGDSLIKTEKEAWRWARDFAKKTKGRFINIYVVDHNYIPVPSYKEKMIENRW